MTSLGLSNLYGHTFVRDKHGHKRVEFQFRVLRRLPPRRWIVQFYSFLDGTPNRLQVYPENFLLSDLVALYPDEETWRHEYDKAEQRYRRQFETFRFNKGANNGANKWQLS